MDIIAKGCQELCLRDIFGIWKLVIGEHGTFGESKDNGCHWEEGGKIGNRR